MNRRSRAGALSTALVAALAVVAAACGGGDGTASPGDTTAPPGTAPDRTVTVDWDARTVTTRGLDGWTIDFCEGDGPFLCVARDGRAVGSVELLEFDSASLDRFDDLEAWARDFYATLAADRREGCGPDYRITGDPPVAARFAGRAGIRYSFTGTSAAGVAVERGVAYAAVRGDRLYLLAANAYDPDGCVGTEGGEFTTDDLVAFEPLLALVADGSRLPSAPAVEATSGYLPRIERSGAVQLDFAEVLTGEEAVEAARRVGAIGPHEDLETDFFVLDTDHALRELRVTDRTTVRLYDCTGPCELREVAAGDFLSGTVRPFGGDRALYTVELAGLEIVSIAEQYLP